MNDQAGSQQSEADKVLEILPRLSRAQLVIVRKKLEALDKAKAKEERDAALREIQRLAKEHDIELGRKRGRPAESKAKRKAEK